LLKKYYKITNRSLQLYMLTYDGLGTEDVTLMLTETWNPRDVRKVVKQASVLTGTENAVDVM